MSAGLAVSIASAGFLFAGGVSGVSSAHAEETDPWVAEHCKVEMNTWKECLADPELAKALSNGDLNDGHSDEVIRFDVNATISQQVIDKAKYISIGPHHLVNRKSPLWVKKPITSLKGIGVFKNLENLEVQNANISQIEGLGKLTNLWRLSLSDNLISRIEGLDKLTNLEVLRLSGNQISTIEGLDTLTKLRVLHLDGNKISRIEGLDKLTVLYALELSKNQISRIGGLNNLTKLLFLNLSDNKISKIEGLDKLTELSELGLRNNQISNIEGLSKESIENIKFNKIYGFDGRENLRKIISEVPALATNINLRFTPSEWSGPDSIYVRQGLTLEGNPISDSVSVPISAPLEPKPETKNPEIKINKPEYVEGEQIDLELAGFTPGDTVTVELHSDVVKVAEVVADANGVARGSFNLPAGFTGEHELVGTDKHGLTSSVKLLIKDANSVELANTGADTSLLGVAGVALLALAGAVTLVARRVKH